MFDKYEKVNINIEELIDVDEEGYQIDKDGNRYDYDDEGNLVKEIKENSKEAKAVEKKEKIEKKKKEDSAVEKKMKEYNGDEDFVVGKNKGNIEERYELKFIAFKDIVVDKRIRLDAKEDIQELGNSIKKNGLIKPILVAPYKDGKYLLIDGYRRLLGCSLADIQKVPCIVNTSLDITKILILECIANNQKRYTMEEKLGYLRKLESHGISDGEQIDSLLQFNNGDYEKIKVVEYAENTGLYGRMEAERLTVEQAYRKATREEKEKDKEDWGDEQQEDDTFDENEEEQDVNTGIMPECEDDEVREAVLERDDYTCQCCGVHGEEYKRVMDCHLKTPKYLGGEEEKKNGITLCVRCHRQVHLRAVGELVIEDKLSDDEIKKLSKEEQMEYEMKQKAMDKIIEMGDGLAKEIKKQGIDIEEIKKQDALIGIDIRMFKSEEEIQKDKEEKERRIAEKKEKQKAERDKKKAEKKQMEEDEKEMFANTETDEEDDFDDEPIVEKDEDVEDDNWDNDNDEEENNDDIEDLDDDFLDKDDEE